MKTTHKKIDFSNNIIEIGKIRTFTWKDIITP